MSISQDDKDFWLDVVKDVTIQKNDVSVLSLRVPPIEIHKRQYYAVKQEFTTYSKALEDNEFGGIDKSLLKRFKREEFKIEAVLDLHGLTEDQAFQKVTDFIPRCYEKNKRCVAVITGKGGCHHQEDIFAPRGVLKNLVPQWLNMPSLRGLILIYKNPSERLGGSGALYILLKKKKNI